jgi:hypothetical protein
MKNTKAVITATTLKQNINYSEVQAFATLNTISKPMWKLHIKDLEFNFYPNPDYILEDGLWQLSLYLDIPYQELSSDMSNNPPDDLENEFDLDTCNEFRSELGNYLNRSEVYYSLMLNEDLINFKNIMLVDQICKQGAYVSITKSPLIKLINK